MICIPGRPLSEVGAPGPGCGEQTKLRENNIPHIPMLSAELFLLSFYLVRFYELPRFCQPAQGQDKSLNVKDGFGHIISHPPSSALPPLLSLYVYIWFYIFK